MSGARQLGDCLLCSAVPDVEESQLSEGEGRQAFSALQQRWNRLRRGQKSQLLMLQYCSAHAAVAVPPRQWQKLVLLASLDCCTEKQREQLRCGLEVLEFFCGSSSALSMVRFQMLHTGHESVSLRGLRFAAFLSLDVNMVRRVCDLFIAGISEDERGHFQVRATMADVAKASPSASSWARVTQAMYALKLMSRSLEVSLVRLIAALYHLLDNRVQLASKFLSCDELVLSTPEAREAVAVFLCQKVYDMLVFALNECCEWDRSQLSPLARCSELILLDCPTAALCAPSFGPAAVRLLQEFHVQQYRRENTVRADEGLQPISFRTEAAGSDEPVTFPPELVQAVSVLSCSKDLTVAALVAGGVDALEPRTELRIALKELSHRSDLECGSLVFECKGYDHLPLLPQLYWEDVARFGVHPYAFLFLEFYDRYRGCCGLKPLPQHVAFVKACLFLVKKLVLTAEMKTADISSLYLVGQSRIFLSRDLYEAAERLRSDWIDKNVCTIRRKARQFLRARGVVETKKAAEAPTVVAAPGENGSAAVKAFPPSPTTESSNEAAAVGRPQQVLKVQQQEPSNRMRRSKTLTNIRSAHDEQVRKDRKAFENAGTLPSKTDDTVNKAASVAPTEQFDPKREARCLLLAAKDWMRLCRAGSATGKESLDTQQKELAQITTKIVAGSGGRSNAIAQQVIDGIKELLVAGRRYHRNGAKEEQALDAALQLVLRSIKSMLTSTVTPAPAASLAASAPSIALPPNKNGDARPAGARSNTLVPVVATTPDRPQQMARSNTVAHVQSTASSTMPPPPTELSRSKSNLERSGPVGVAPQPKPQAQEATVLPAPTTAVTPTVSSLEPSSAPSSPPPSPPTLSRSNTLPVGALSASAAAISGPPPLVRSNTVTNGSSAAADFVAPSSPPPPRPKSPKPTRVVSSPPVPSSPTLGTRYRNLLACFDGRSSVVQSLLERCRDPEKGFPRNVHRCGELLVSNSFIAKECVVWLIKNGFCVSAPESAKIFSAMVADDILFEVHKEPQLSHCVFRFRTEDSVPVTTAALVAASEPVVVAPSASPPPGPLTSTNQALSSSNGAVPASSPKPSHAPSAPVLSSTASPLETSFQNLLKLGNRPNRRHLYRGPAAPLGEWISLSPMRSMSTLREAEWAPIVCGGCGAQNGTGSRQCTKCGVHLFRNPNGKPLRLLIKLLNGFNYELGCRLVCSSVQALDNELQVDDWRVDFPLYTERMRHVPHDVFVGHPDAGPLLCCCEKFDNLEEARTARMIIYTDRGVDVACVVGTDSRDLSERLKIVSRVLDTVGSPSLHVVTNARIQDELVEVERKFMQRTYKFGVLLMKEGQTKEEEFYANCEGSRHYEDFLSLIGKRVVLAEHKGFRGGLECKGHNSTGTHSVYEKLTFNEEGTLVLDPSFSGSVIEVMFHVATMLPFTDEQQLQRKRHVGNDVVVVIFREENARSTTFDPNTMRSQFNHVFVVVTPSRISPTTGECTHYHIQIANRPGVKPSRPFLPIPSVFKRNELFKLMFLIKLINAERAAMYAKDFAVRLARTRREVLADLQKRFY